MIIRVATQLDLPELAKLYSESVQAIAPGHYSSEQVKVWAAFSADPDFFCQFILEPTTFVAEAANTILGFAGIKDDGHITAVYVHRNYLRQGIGSRLLKAVLEYAQSQKINLLYSEASEFSKPLFEKLGFEAYATEQVVRNNVLFQRYLVRKYLLIP